MKYLVVQEWGNTKGNHAGMVHMCDLLVAQYPEIYEKVEIPLFAWTAAKKRGRILGHLLRIYDTQKAYRHYVNTMMEVCSSMLNRLSASDEVFLLEYNWKETPQVELAKYIRNHFKGVRIHALSHLTPTYFRTWLQPLSYLKEWSKYVDTELTMGKDLSLFLESQGVEGNMISTGFHYVDNVYYDKDETKICPKERMTIIAMGGLQRDFTLLSDIVNSTPEVDWIICQGRKHLDNYFHGENVRLVGFVPEDELKALMDASDASINVMEDTVGSNVITTSLAMGLVVIASKVGSIGDYVDEHCGCLCQNTKDSFVEAIRQLAANPMRVVTMRQASYQRSKLYSIEKLHSWFSNL